MLLLARICIHNLCELKSALDDRVDGVRCDQRRRSGARLRNASRSFAYTRRSRLTSASHVATNLVGCCARVVRLFDCTHRSLLTCNSRLAGTDKNGGDDLLCARLPSGAATCRQTARLHHRRNPHFRPSIENVSCSYIICCRCFQSFAICDSFFTVAETILNKFVLNHIFNC